MSFDIAIIGAGMAGASLAAEIGDRARVLLIEAEPAAGYHATGRSAAFWSETYGGPGIQPLTTASGDSLRAGGFLDPLGSLHIGRASDAAQADAFLADFADSGVPLLPVDPREHVHGLRAGWTIGIMEPTCAYIDVAALHADALARARRGGAQLVLNAALTGATRLPAGWRLETNAGVHEAAVLVNAAGAWADQVARLAGVSPLNIQPYRRTMVQLRTDPAPAAGVPHVVHIGGDFYFKPEAGGRLWLSPHDETPVDPGDVQPEELDVAVAIDRFEQAVDWRITQVERRWAGLRSFAPDRLPVYGFAPDGPGFFWFAGQGGFGIQTAPAAAMIGAALLLGTDPVLGIDVERYAPTRFRSA
ncbi:NAD(P)/FAD-dependent oxidoreductase [Sphingomonas mucosissima]|uniref:Hydrogen cyanide synthase subunit HcnC n=1 Tax=Sphingomonas mucosissima TaxID=370959 RepID=A0A245ZEW0_9SPHN|nr:FAD-dependent oxidoreductase [Sphingomonas mucosissima]OWK28292.1 hydrogen cyanide synthase subunit HcnC precursor [Sphingomonas mucosissima]